MKTRKSSPIPPSLMPPEPYIEINHTPQQHNYANYPGTQYSVTVRNQQNNSQKVHLLQGTLKFNRTDWL